jgi:hypothetical protein
MRLLIIKEETNYVYLLSRDGSTQRKLQKERKVRLWKVFGQMSAPVCYSITVF